jgi:GNAT superfamily N-acetyltransferase
VTAAPVLPIPAVPAAAPPTGIWWARIPRRGTGAVEHSLVAVRSDRFPAGAAVDFSALAARGRRPAGWLVDVRHRPADGAVIRLDTAEEVARPGLPLCFAEVHHASAAIPTVSLLAFAAPPFRPGALLAPHQAAAAGIRLDAWIGEVRWYVRSGLVDTVRVQPAHRGRGLGRLLVTAAEGLRALRGWPALHGDGRLTDSAAAWLAGAPSWWRPRLAVRTHRLPEAHADAPGGVERLLGDLPSRLI